MKRLLLYTTGLLALGLLWGGCQGEAPAEPTAPSAPEASSVSAEAEVACPHHAAGGLPPTELPSTSVFHLDHPFTDTTGATRHLRELRGQPSVVVMFYAGCTTACPILFADGKRLEGMLSPEVRARVRFVYVTIDPANDTPEVLGAYARKLELDMSRWMLLQASEPHTRALAAVLGVQYRGDGQGSFSHTSRLALLDGEGTVVGTVDGLKQPLEDAAAQLTKLVEAR